MMIFYLHYILLTSGLSGTSVLLGVFFNTYSDASQGEIGFLLMTFPVVSIFIRPLFCSLADRHQAHRLYLILALIVMLIGYAPFSIVPFFPGFYLAHPRWSWYLLAIACQIGNGGLGVAWSLGDTLTVNQSQRTGIPYSRVRLMGTISWGVYGYIIGQINEIPLLPKYVPAFIILNISVVLELLCLAFWSNDDFQMYDASQEEQATPDPLELTAGANKEKPIDEKPLSPVGTLSRRTATEYLHREVDSTPSSLGGTLRLSSRTVVALRDIIGADDLTDKLKQLETLQEAHNQEQQQEVTNNNNNNIRNVYNHNTFTKMKALEFNANGSKQQQLVGSSWTIDCEKNDRRKSATESLQDSSASSDTSSGQKNKNPQIIIFKLIMREDYRLVKYMILFCVYGIIFSPMNFLFISLSDVSKERGYNFSQLAGSVLISQATVETLSFLVLPWILVRINRQTAFAFGLLSVLARFVFYAFFLFSDSSMSPYWALVGEWAHGISYGIACTIMADMAFRFACQSKLFIPELRALGYLSVGGSVESMRAEEQAIGMALRATMQAVFTSFMDGLGSAIGNLLCGVIVDAYSYIRLWQILATISAIAFLLYLMVEVISSRFSDSYKPEKGTKLYEIMLMDAEFEAKARGTKPLESKVPVENSLTTKQQLSGKSVAGLTATSNNKESAHCNENC